MAIKPRTDGLGIIVEPYSYCTVPWLAFLEDKFAHRLIYEVVPGDRWTDAHVRVLDEIRELYWASDNSTTEIRNAYMPNHPIVHVAKLAGPVRLSKGCRGCGGEVFVTSHFALNRIGHTKDDCGCDCPACWQVRHDLSQQEWQIWHEKNDRDNQLTSLDRCTTPYQEYLKTEHWRQTRDAALRRSGYSCQLCSAQGELHVHHRTYVRRGRELDSDLIVLCAGCHEIFHANGKLADNGRALAETAESPFTSREEVMTIAKGLLDSGIQYTQWETEFLEHMVSDPPNQLSARQLIVLDRLADELWPKHLRQTVERVENFSTWEWKKVENFH